MLLTKMNIEVVLSSANNSNCTNSEPSSFQNERGGDFGDAGASADYNENSTNTSTGLLD